MRQLPHLTLNNGLRFSLNGSSRLSGLKQLHGIEDWGQRVAKFMAEHRQKFIFAVVQVGERCSFLLHLSLQAAAFRDVTDVALNDLVMVLRIDIADELDFDLLPVFAFER